jgi:hypothetical protein
MSILSTLALMITAAIRPKFDPRDREIIALKAEVNDLRRERDDARIEADRWRALARRWEERFQARQSPEVIAQYQAQQLLGQQYAHMQQYAQMQQGLGQKLGMQNVQAPQSLFEGFCNCVPARHDLFLLG